MAMPVILRYGGNYSRTCCHRLTRVVFLVIWVIWSFDIRTSSASPVAGEEWDKSGEDSSHAVILRRSLQDLKIADPHEKCFETTCNRVTHYCDQVIRSCASCEDDCHPGRISGDDDTVKDCLKKCDWYYYINSLKSNLCLTSGATHEPGAALTGPTGAELTDYQMFAIILAVVTLCFTTIVILLVGVFCCILKKSLAKPTVVRQEDTAPIYRPKSLRPYSSTDSKRRQNIGDTDIKLLAECSEGSISNRVVQQESVRNSSNTPSSISLASNSQGLNCCNNSSCAGQDQRHSNSFHQSHTDSSTRQLVK